MMALTIKYHMVEAIISEISNETILIKISH